MVYYIVLYIDNSLYGIVREDPEKQYILTYSYLLVELVFLSKNKRNGFNYDNCVI